MTGGDLLEEGEERRKDQRENAGDVLIDGSHQLLLHVTFGVGFTVFHLGSGRLECSYKGNVK